MTNCRIGIAVSVLGLLALSIEAAPPSPSSVPADLVLRNVSTGQFQVYNIANNQLTGSASLGAVGLDWQLGGFAGVSSSSSGAFAGASDDQLVQAMAGFGGGGAGDGLNAGLNADTSQQPLIMTPQYA